ncbi:MAG: hypothetical protein FD180_3194 [Planctomycetota bacterium]|nr:MAG: hypothetical protein FD180_3194 [Planctomycetota bacterium]
MPKKNASLVRRLQDELKVCRSTARQHGRDASRCIAERKFFLAITTLIEAELAQSEAGVLARVSEWLREDMVKQT